MSTDILDRLAEVARQSEGWGPTGTEVTEALHGFNMMPTHHPLRSNTDTLGYVFFTRPRLNLSYNNLLLDRRLSPFLTQDPKTLHYAIKHMLSPDLIKIEGEQGASPIFMHDQAFIPILSNALDKLDNWEDGQIDTYTTPEGIAKESHSWADGIYAHNGTFDLTATFHNTNNDPVTLMLVLWLTYISNVYLGYMTPWPSNMFGYFIDYYTAIYRFVLDMNEECVSFATRTGWSFPTADNLGAKFRYDRENPTTAESSIITIPFRSVTAHPLDPRIIVDFNTCTQIHCPEMRDAYREKWMIQVSREDRPFLNSWTYPRINPDTMVFEWWIKIADYNRLLG